LKTNLVKSCYKFCWQEGYKFNRKFDLSDDVDKVVADI